MIRIKFGLIYYSAKFYTKRHKVTIDLCFRYDIIVEKFIKNNPIYYIYRGKGGNVTRHTLSVLVNNHMGVLSRVSGLFSRRGYNIESISVGTTEDKNISRMTIIVDCEDDIYHQIKNQLAKLMDVITIEEFFDSECVKRELALIKIDSKNEKRSQILEIANIFRAHVIDVTNNTMILEIIGDQSKVSAIISMLDDYGIKEVIRTGATAMARGESELKNNRG